MACIFPSQEIPFFLSATAFSPFFLTEEFSFLLFFNIPSYFLSLTFPSHLRKDRKSTFLPKQKKRNTCKRKVAVEWNSDRLDYCETWRVFTVSKYSWLAPHLTRLLYDILKEFK